MDLHRATILASEHFLTEGYPSNFHLLSDSMIEEYISVRIGYVYEDMYESTLRYQIEEMGQTIFGAYLEGRHDMESEYHD